MTAEQTRKAALAASKEAQAMAKLENAKHTPGPWVATKNGFAVCAVKAGENWITYEAGTQYVMDTGEIEANARLIAAAPELLEALVDVMFRHVPFDNKSEYATKARAVIAKATGETP